VVIGSGAPDLVALATERGWEIASGNDEDGVAQIVEPLLAERRIPNPAGKF
jgi:hypothetical protein